MKLVLPFAVVITLASAWILPIREKIRITRNMCVSTSHISSDHVAMIDNFVYPNTDEVHRYMKCVFEDLDIWDNDQGFQHDDVANIMQGSAHRDTILNAVDICNEQTKSKDTDAWLFDAIGCITSGPMGEEVKDFIRQVKNEYSFPPYYGTESVQVPCQNEF